MSDNQKGHISHGVAAEELGVQVRARETTLNTIPVWEPPISFNLELIMRESWFTKLAVYDKVGGLSLNSMHALSNSVSHATNINRVFFIPDTKQ